MFTERVIAHLRDLGTMAIFLVEQYFDFAQELADRFTVLDRGEVILDGKPSDFAEAEVRRHLTI